MGLFEKAGRRFERLKQQASDAAKEGAQYECTACEERLFTDAAECPECGADAVERIETADAPEAESEESTTDSGESADEE